MELTLCGCSVTHIPKDSKKKKHELKIVHQGADPLVLALQSQEQAEEWLKVTMAGLWASTLLVLAWLASLLAFVAPVLMVTAFDAQVMREVCASGNVDLDGARSGSPVYKPDLEKVKGS